MRLVKIGIANVNTTVGATRSNTDRALDLAHSLARRGVSLACFSEQVIGGYPPEDLVHWQAFVQAQRLELERFAHETADHGTAFVLGLTQAVGGQLFNVAAVVHGGRILGLVPKEKLPTYDIFYEGRTFSRGVPGMLLDAAGIPLGDQMFAFDFGTIAVEVCEDVWSPDGPMRRRCYSGAELVANISASPYRVGMTATRREMLATRSSDNQTTLVYANAIGAQDGLIYDGGGFVFQNGRLEAEIERFREGITTCVVDLDRTLRLRRENTTWRLDCEEFLSKGKPVVRRASSRATPSTAALPYPAPPGRNFFLPAARSVPGARERVLDDLFDAVALGVRDYFGKTAAFRCFGIALSGGRDSMLTLLVAWRAVQLLTGHQEGEALRASVGELLHAFYMPSRHSGAATREAAATLCAELGVTLHTIAIDEAVEREMSAVTEMLGGASPTEITRQNVQARVRAQRMWNWANSAGALFLQSGDMSEKAVGYTTIGGDLEGALAVIANIPKTVVVALLERALQRWQLRGIEMTLATSPGPELADGQEAEAELMPFEVLDCCLYLYAAEKLSPDEMARALPAIFPEHAPEQLRAWAHRFATLFSRSIYKWVQAPLSLHVGSLDLDRERALQLPVVQRNEWTE